MSTSTAPDFYPVAVQLPRVAVAPGVTLELLVVAAADGQYAGVDLASGALVRAWSAEPAPYPIQPYDVVLATLAEDLDAVPDPCEPEALMLAGPPEPPRRRIVGRRAQRLLRPLVHPQGQPLLGMRGSVVPFWERRADHPSIALVEPEGPITLMREGGYLGCRFGWMGHEHELPCLDRRMAELMDRGRRGYMACGKGDRLVVAITPPIDGRCHKVVEAILPRP